MVNEGAAIGIVDPDLIIPLGIVILDEPAKRLLFMQQWAHALRLSDSSKALGRADHRDGVGHNVSDIHKLSVWSDRDASGPLYYRNGLYHRICRRADYRDRAGIKRWRRRQTFRLELRQRRPVNQWEIRAE